jgi:hypothetical protein
MRPAFWLLLAALVLPHGALEAQRLAPNPFPSLDAQPSRAAPTAALSVDHPGTHPALLAVSGVVGGAAGLLAGAYVGSRVTEGDCEDCFFIGGAYGAVAGWSSGIPLGVHLANGGRGRLLPSLGSSLAIGALGLGAAAASDRYEIMVAVPVLQLVSSILIERGTSPPR